MLRGPDGRFEPRVPHILYEAAERLASGILRQVVEYHRYVLSREEGQCDQSLDVHKRSCIFHILLL